MNARDDSLLTRTLIAGYVLLLTISWTPFPSMVQWSEIFFAAVLGHAAIRGDLKGWRWHPVDALVNTFDIMCVVARRTTA
jgi:hypothetical protein